MVTKMTDQKFDSGTIALLYAQEMLGPDIQKKIDELSNWNVPETENLEPFPGYFAFHSQIVSFFNAHGVDGFNMDELQHHYETYLQLSHLQAEDKRTIVEKQDLDKKIQNANQRVTDYKTLQEDNLTNCINDKESELSTTQSELRNYTSEIDEKIREKVSALEHHTRLWLDHPDTYLQKNFTRFREYLETVVRRYVKLEDDIKKQIVKFDEQITDFSQGITPDISYPPIHISIDDIFTPARVNAARKITSEKDIVDVVTSYLADVESGNVLQKAFLSFLSPMLYKPMLKERLWDTVKFSFKKIHYSYELHIKDTGDNFYSRKIDAFGKLNDKAEELGLSFPAVLGVILMYYATEGGKGSEGREGVSQWDEYIHGRCYIEGLKAYKKLSEALLGYVHSAIPDTAILKKIKRQHNLNNKSVNYVPQLPELPDFDLRTFLKNAQIDGVEIRSSDWDLYDMNHIRYDEEEYADARTYLLRDIEHRKKELEAPEEADTAIGDILQLRKELEQTTPGYEEKIRQIESKIETLRQEYDAISSSKAYTKLKKQSETDIEGFQAEINSLNEAFSMLEVSINPDDISSFQVFYQKNDTIFNPRQYGVVFSDWNRQKLSDFMKTLSGRGETQ